MPISVTDAYIHFTKDILDVEEDVEDEEGEEEVSFSRSAFLSTLDCELFKLCLLTFHRCAF